MNGMAKSKPCRTLLLAKQIAHSLFQNRFPGLAFDLAHTCLVFQKCFTVLRKMCERIEAYNAGMRRVRRPGLTAEQMGQQSFSHSVNNLFPTLAFIILMMMLTILMIIPTIILNFDLVLQTFMFRSRPM